MTTFSATNEVKVKLREHSRTVVISALADVQSSRYSAAITPAEVMSKLAELGDDFTDLETYRYEAVSNLLSTRDELAGKMADARRTFEQADRFIKGEAASFNSLGLLQSDGPRIDALAMLFKHQVDAAVLADFRMRLAYYRATGEYLTIG